MKISLPLLIALFFCASFISAQQYIFGKVYNEEDKPLSGAQIVNMRTDEIVVADTKGVFMIGAKSGDKIRVVMERYERQEFRTTVDNYSKPVNIVMIRPEVEIPEVQIAFVPSGNLEKDVRALKTPAKIDKLNNELSAYMMKPPVSREPRLSMPQTMAMGPNFSAGQVDVVGLLSAAVALITKATAPKVVPPDYYERQQFFAEVRTKVDRKYFEENGLDDYQFDELVAYADERFGLSMKYRKNFDKVAVTSFLKLALKDFLMLQKPVKSSGRTIEKNAEIIA